MKQLKKSSFLVLTIGFGLILLGSSIPAMAGVHLIAVIPVPGRPLTSFDISWVDAPTQTCFLADRSNFGVAPMTTLSLPSFSGRGCIGVYAND